MEDPRIFDAFDDTVFPDSAHEFPFADAVGQDLQDFPPDEFFNQSKQDAPPHLQDTRRTVQPVVLNQQEDHMQIEETFFEARYPYELFHQGPGPARDTAIPTELRDNIKKRQYEDEEGSVGSHRHSLATDVQQIAFEEAGDDPPSQHPSLTNSKSARKRQRISEEKWEKHRQVIERLYLAEDKSLSEVMIYMDEHFHFKAPRTAYIMRLNLWKCRKILSEELKKLIWKKICQRGGKHTVIRYRRVLVPKHKIMRRSSSYRESMPVISTPSSLSVKTPDIEHSTHSDPSSPIRDQSPSASLLETSQHSTPTSQRKLRQSQVILHQHTENQPELVPEVISSSLSIEDRLAESSWNQQRICDELNGYRTIAPLVELLPEAVAQDSSVAHRTAELLLEMIMTKCEEVSDCQDSNSSELQEYQVAFAQSLVSQRKFGQAGLIIDGIRRGPEFADLQNDQKIRLLKLRLRVDIGDDFEEPRLMAKIETRCKDLLAREISETEKPSLRCMCPSNLIPAFLFRLYGIKNRELDSFAVSTIVTAVKEQMCGEHPPLSAIWAAQQHVRYCLRSCAYKDAKDLLKLIREALVKRKRKGRRKDRRESTPEADLTDDLYAQLQSSRHQSGRARTPKDFEVYEKHPVDEKWLKIFKAYVQDKSHACPDETKLTREMDVRYWD